MFWCEAMRMAARPTVLLLVIDDLRTEVGTYGYKHMRTPHIDQLAREGVRFGQAYASWPVCARAPLSKDSNPLCLG